MLPEFMQAPCGQRRPEFLTWAALVLSHDAQSYVELGTGHAGYFVGRIPKIVAVDLTNPDEQLSDGVYYLRGNSHDPQTLERVLAYLGEPPDVVFIDADHDGPAPRQDFDLWWPHARRLVGFHDILIPNIEHNIWPEIGLTHPSVKIIACDDASAVAWQGPGAPRDGVLSGGGIGVCFK